MENKPSLEYKIKSLPDKSGVYIMKNAEGEVIYVGKAKVLKNRVRQYFRGNNHTPKVAAMVSNVADFEYIITDSEPEALVLECNLIKQYMPKYNILLKDDKTYPFARVSVNERFPKITMVRSVKNCLLYTSESFFFNSSLSSPQSALKLPLCAYSPLVITG